MKRFLLCLLNFLSLGIVKMYSGDIVLESFNTFNMTPLTPNTTYVITDTLDLHDKILSIPDNCKIKFKDNGYILNGVIIGHNTQILADCKKIFSSTILFEGTWKNKRVYGEWIDYPKENKSSNEYFQNIFTLCKGEVFTHLYTSEYTYYVEAENDRGSIKIPSNLYWHNLSTVVMLPTDKQKYSNVHLYKSDNVKIDGGRFIGDVETHIGNKGEWGHGIKCSGATNVELINLTCNYCWGDGIDLIEAYDEDLPIVSCNNILISNVTCFYNRRQGISIEAAENVIIENSEFAYTGKIKATAPSAGLDIEPWDNSCRKIYGIKINNCSFHDNAGFDFKSQPNHLVDSKYRMHELNKISISKSNIDRCQIWRTYGLSISNSRVNSFTLSESDKIDVQKCYIGVRHCNSNGRDVRFKSIYNLSHAAVPMLLACIGIMSIKRKKRRIK